MIRKATFRMLIACSCFFIGTVSDAAQKGNASLEHLPSTNVQGAVADYSNTTYGISFKYPKDWQESKAEGKEALVKFAGANSDGLHGEVILNRYTDGSTPESILSFINQYVGNLADFKKVQEKKVAIGVNRKLAATLEDVTFNLGTLKFEQRYAVFQHKDATYTLVFTSPIGHFNSMAPIFNNILLSVQTGSSIASSTKGVAMMPLANATEKAIVLRSYKANNLPVSFDYPADWKVASGTHHDEAVSMHGANSKGHEATIVLNRGDMHAAPLSIDEVADALQKEYFDPLKNYHRVTRQNQNFGRSSKVNGVVQEQTFDQDGLSVKQMVAMFYHKDKTYALSIVAPGWKDSDMHQLFYKVLATVDVHD